MKNDERKESRAEVWERQPPVLLLRGGLFGIGILVAGALVGGREGEVVGSFGALLTFLAAALFFARLLFLAVRGT